MNKDKREFVDTNMNNTNMNEFDNDTKFQEEYNSYMEFLEQHRDQLAEGVTDTVKTDMYQNFNNHDCPHDSWLQELIISHVHDPYQKIIKIKLLGAYHDRQIILRYHNVILVNIVDDSNDVLEWYKDKFTLTDSNIPQHQIRWRNGSEWKIQFTGQFSYQARDFITSQDEIQ